MYRSFTDRIFGGVCGGLAAIIPLGVWWFRAAFILLSLVTLGAFAAFYLLLWLMIPQESPAVRQRGGSGRLLLVIILTVLMLAGWVASITGNLQGPSGQNLYAPVVLLILAIAFFLRQVRA
ncbi:MAG: PspC domain-containing protein [Chloroflexi bacterium]|nr:PspC domain-containing protein [Chloroflexota bacterium]MCC6892362.1 PspC domain-containing protein [Anaerolineae bacterium]